MNQKIINNLLKNATLGIMLLTLLSKGFGFIREIIFSYLYGASSLADAYILSLSVATIIFGFIGNGITTGFIPMYTKITSAESKERANIFASNLIITYITICAIIILFLNATLDNWIKLLANGFDNQHQEIAVNLCRISIFTIFSTGLSSIATGILHINKIFLIPACIGFPLNFFIIIFLFISKQTDNYYLLGIGNLIAVYSQLFILIPFLFRTDFKFKIKNLFQDKYIKNIFILSLPIILSVSVNQINVLIDKSLASNFVGGVAFLNYSHTVISIMNDVVITAFITVLYPKISKLLAEGEDVCKIFNDYLSYLQFLLIPSAIIICLSSNTIISFLFERGAFTAKNVEDCSKILSFYSLCIPFVGIRQLLIRFFYANQDTITPVINASIAVAINIILNFPLMNKFGVSGLALATSISSVISVLLLSFSANKKINISYSKTIIIEIIKISIATIIMGIFTYYINTLSINIYAKAISVTLVSLLIYLTTIIILKSKTFFLIFAKFKYKKECNL